MVLFMSNRKFHHVINQRLNARDFAKPARPPFVPAPPLTTNLDHVAHRSATNLDKCNQTHRQNDGHKPVCLFVAIALAVIWIAIGAFGVPI